MSLPMTKKKIDFNPGMLCYGLHGHCADWRLDSSPADSYYPPPLGGSCLFTVTERAKGNLGEEMLFTEAHRQQGWREDHGLQLNIDRISVHTHLYSHLSCWCWCAMFPQVQRSKRTFKTTPCFALLSPGLFSSRTEHMSRLSTALIHA